MADCAPDDLVLIVEDDVLLADDVAAVIESALPVRTLILRSLADAMAYKGETPCFAILDIDLGDGRVFPLADRLEFEKVPFLFVSGSRRDDLPERFKHRPFLPKPYPEQALLEFARSCWQGNQGKVA